RAQNKWIAALQAGVQKDDFPIKSALSEYEPGGLLLPTEPTRPFLKALEDHIKRSTCHQPLRPPPNVPVPESGDLVRHPSGHLDATARAGWSGWANAWLRLQVHDGK